MGAKSVYAAATHPVLSGPAIERLEQSAICETILLNTLPVPEEKKIEKFTFLSVAPLFAEAMTRVFIVASTTLPSKESADCLQAARQTIAAMAAKMIFFIFKGLV